MELNKDETETAENIVIIKIKPQKYDDKTIDKIEIDLDKITGKVMLDAEREFALGRNINTGILQTNIAFAAIVASKISNVDIDFLKAMPGKKFSEVIVSVQGFLMPGA